MYLTCDDFIGAGLVDSISCCPYCHEGEQYLYDESFVSSAPGSSRIKAVVCCGTYFRTSRMNRNSWAKALLYRRVINKK